MANNEGIRGLREQIFDNAALLFPEAIKYHRSYQATSHTVQSSEVFSIVVLKETKPGTQVFDQYGRSKSFGSQGAPLGYQAVVMYGEEGNRWATSGKHEDTVHRALESLLEVLALSAATSIERGCTFRTI
ncbi:unnamed protein product [Zymoseptoria tritici ST99CH_1E4]|uniref:Uncharacterized protein n=1 Tax=Zymoseptoria tritici ST99CH_1E4 TaxID=1276532 RepID=A0A2H1GM26_ZYMTR|nr:unnamed protein product [Zymoseptoria tritici ST99CH_1E4]